MNSKFRHLLFAAVFCASATMVGLSQGTNASPAAAAKPAATPYRFPTNRTPSRAERYYAMLWGVDALTVKLAESGELVRFSYRVVDEQKAKILTDKKVDPYLYDARAHVQLVIPSLEKVGALRQISSEPVAGQSYWMAFSNAGRPVKKGDQVSISIGKFRVDGLVVQ